MIEGKKKKKTDVKKYQERERENEWIATKKREKIDKKDGGAW